MAQSLMGQGAEETSPGAIHQAGRIIAALKTAHVDVELPSVPGRSEKFSAHDLGSVQIERVSLNSRDMVQIRVSTLTPPTS